MRTQTITDENGNFQLERVGQGPFSFVTTGPTGFSAYGINVLAHAGGQNNLNVMEAELVSPGISGIKQVLLENFPAEIAEEIMQSTLTAKTQPTPTTAAHKIRLINGQLHGQVTSVASGEQQVPGAIVNLIQNGSRIADVQVDQQGNFKIPDLEPGVYDFIAVGINGIAAIRFEALGPDSPMTQIGYRRTPKLIATTLVVALTTKHGSSSVDDSISYSSEPTSYPVYDAPVEYAGESTGFGTAAGGSAGSYSSYPVYSAPARGGFGGGRIRGGRIGGGRMFGLAAFGLGLGALIKEDGDTIIINNPPPQSPYSN